MFYPQSSTERLYINRKKGGRGLLREHVVKADEQSLKSYFSRKAESDHLSSNAWWPTAGPQHRDLLYNSAIKISRHSKLAETYNTERYKSVASIVYTAMCTTPSWNDGWQLENMTREKKTLQTDIEMPHNWPVIILIDHQQKTGLILIG